MSDKKITLTPKQKIFIREYCKNGFNGTQAAIKAGYSEHTALVIGSENLAKPYIRDAIKKYLDSVIGQYKDTLEYEIIHTYKLLAFYEPSDIVDENGLLIHDNLKDYGELAKCITGIETTYNREGLPIKKVKLADRENALKQLSMYMELMQDNNININNNVTVTDLNQLMENWLGKDNSKTEPKTKDSD
jgi:phage terminase small subunit